MPVYMADYSPDKPESEDDDPIKCQATNMKLFKELMSEYDQKKNL